MARFLSLPRNPDSLDFSSSLKFLDVIIFNLVLPLLGKTLCLYLVLEAPLASAFFTLLFFPPPLVSGFAKACG